MMGELVPFPKRVVELTKEEHEKFKEYRKKMEDARTIAEVKYYYSMAKNIIEKANKREK